MPGKSGSRDRGADARHDLERNARVRERERLFAATAEHERIATLEPDDALAALGRANHQTVDELLRDRMTAGALADVDTAAPIVARSSISGSISAS